PPEAARALERHGFPGNVRELRNVLDRAAALGWNEAVRILGRGPDTDAQAPEGTTQPVTTSPSNELLALPFTAFRERWSDLGDRPSLDRLLEQSGGSVPIAANKAGVDASSLYRILRRLGRTQ